MMLKCRQKNISSDISINSKEGKLNFNTSYNGVSYIYSTIVYQFTIPADNVNREAVEKYNLSSNEYVMDDKILVDNLTTNSGYFTFDNVVVQNARARGVVCKTVNATIKNCTFRNLAAAGTNIRGCYNVKVEGNIFENGDVSEVVIANNYVGLTGADVKDIFPETKEKAN